MRSELTVSPIRNQPTIFSFNPRSFEEAMQFSKLISESDFCPKDHRGKPGNVFAAIQYGSEIGLSPMQALQNISVINGRPCVWGDALLALVMAHQSFIDIEEVVINGKATCTLQRKNRKPVTRTFSIDDAKKANLFSKAGPWTQYQERMLQQRARTFALRDMFPDVLKGITTREEVEDYNVKPTKYIKPIDEVKQINEPIKVIEVKENTSDQCEEAKNIGLKQDIEYIEQSQDIKDLQVRYTELIKEWQRAKNMEAIKQIIAAKDKRKSELEVEEFQKELKEDTGEVS